MKQYTAIFSIVILGLLTTLASCSKPSEIGSDLLNEDLQDLSFSEDFSIKTYTLFGDSVQTFAPALSSQLPEYYFGVYNDPLFGQVSSSIYAQVGLNGAGPEFEGASLDSVVLVLPYLPGVDYGNINSQYGIDVLPLSEVINTEEDYFSNAVFNTEADLIGSKNFVPKNSAETDSLFIEVPRNDTIGTVSTKVGPQLRITMNSEFAQELFTAGNMEEDSVFFSDAYFKDKFLAGMHLKPASENDGLFAFGIRDNINAGLFVYYHTDTTTLSYRFPFTSSDLKMTAYEHDYSGSDIEDLVDNADQNDSLVYVQGFAGVDTWIEFPDLSELEGDVAINKAELTLTVASNIADLEAYSAPEQLILSRMDDNDDSGDFFFIEDLSRGIVDGAISERLFGGNLTESQIGGETTYTMNITAFMQNVLDGQNEPKVRLSVNQKQRRPDRTVIYGGSHSLFAPKLKIYYTKL